MGPRNSCVVRAECPGLKGQHRGLLFLLFRSDFSLCQDVYHGVLSSALTNVQKDMWHLQKQFPYQLECRKIPGMQEEKRQKADGDWGCSCEWAEYGTYVTLFISRDIEMYTVWNWNKWINVLSQHFFFYTTLCTVFQRCIRIIPSQVWMTTAFEVFPSVESTQWDIY